MGKREERIRKRRKRIIQCLTKRGAFDIEHGMTVKGIIKELDETESVIRIDLANLKADGVGRDQERIPNVYWLKRRKEK